MTPDEQRDANEAWEISDKAFVDGIELLHLIEVMQGLANDRTDAKLSAESVAGATAAIRNGLLSRIVLFLAGAFADPKLGDLHLGRAFDLLKQPAVRDELGFRGSPTLLDEAIRLWARCKGDHRLPLIKHFRDKYTAHLGTPKNDVGLPSYDDIFGFARETVAVIGALALATGARDEPLSNWQPQAAEAAAHFWSAWAHD